MMNRIHTEQARRIAADNMHRGVMAIAEAAFEAGLSCSRATSKMGMTAKQAMLLDFIQQHVEAHHGVAPSFEEMKEAMGLRSKSGIHRLVTALEERGKIARLPDRARAIEVVRTA